MNNFQKTIKYIAIGFAVFLAIAIISAIANLGGLIFSYITGESMDTNSGNYIDIDQSFSEVSNIDIRGLVGNLKIKKGDEIKVNVDNAYKNIEVNVQNDGTLRIWEEDNFRIFNWFENRKADSEITLYLPEDFVAKKTYIGSSVGKTTIDFLKSDNLEIDAGVGNIQGSNIHAQDVDIKGGVGNIDLRDVTFYNVDIDSGVGNVALELNGDEKDYNLDIDSGIGRVKVNGKQISGATYKHEGASHWITVDGGIGDISISFK